MVRIPALELACPAALGKSVSEPLCASVFPSKHPHAYLLPQPGLTHCPASPLSVPLHFPPIFREASLDNLETSYELTQDVSVVGV